MCGRRAFVIPLVLLTVVATGAPAAAQTRVENRFRSGLSEGLRQEAVLGQEAGVSSEGSGHFGREAASEPHPAFAVLASAVLPGAGQYLQGQDRWVPYLVIEAWAWGTYLVLRRHSNGFARDYRDLAWSVARRVSSGERRDTVFEYYETLSYWETSGAWDVDPRTPGVQPELDALTFNGDVWRLARALFIPGGASAPPGSPEYERALDYYLRHAIPAGYAWAWGPSSLEQQRFRELIRESDEAARAATLRLGIILANHVVSAVDALVLARIRENRADGLRVRLRSGLERASADVRWSASLRLEW